MVIAEQPTTYRMMWGVLGLAMALLVTSSLAVQISDLILQGEFDPATYFSYFTIHTSLANVAALATGALLAFQSERDTVGVASLRLILVSYSLITGVVYNLLLRGNDLAMPVIETTIPFPNEVFHVVVPGYLLVEWLLNPHRPRVPWAVLPLALAYPLAWVAFTLWRGGETGWYPYYFLNPTHASGWSGVVNHVIGIGVLIVASVATLLLVNRGMVLLSGRIRLSNLEHEAA